MYNQLQGNTECRTNLRSKDISSWSMNWENQVREQLLIVTAHKMHMKKNLEHLEQMKNPSKGHTGGF